MRSRTLRLRPALVLLLLAWFAQLCLPVAHAALMAAPRGELLGWCGDPSRAAAIVAELPAEIRQGLGADDAGAGPLADPHVGCAQLCATGAAPTPDPVACTVLLRAAGLEPAPAKRPQPRSRAQAPTPPSQGPPALA